MEEEAASRGTKRPAMYISGELQPPVKREPDEPTPSPDMADLRQKLQETEANLQHMIKMERRGQEMVVDLKDRVKYLEELIDSKAGILRREEELKLKVADLTKELDEGNGWRVMEMVKVTDLTKELEEERRRPVELQMKLDEMEKKVTDMTKELDEANGRHLKGSEIVAGLSKELNEAKQRHAIEFSRVVNLMKELEEERKRPVELQLQLGELKKEVAASTKELELANERHSVKVANMNVKLEEEHKRLAERELKIAELEKKMDEKTNELRQVKANNVNSAARLVNLTNELDGMRKSSTEDKQRLVELDDLKKRVANQTSELEQAKAKHVSDSARLNDLQTALEKEKKRVEDLEKENEEFERPTVPQRLLKPRRFKKRREEQIRIDEAEKRRYGWIHSCICGVKEDNGEATISCTECKFRKEHVSCIFPDRGNMPLPDKYRCHACWIRPTYLAPEQAREYQAGVKTRSKKANILVLRRMLTDRKNKSEKLSRRESLRQSTRPNGKPIKKSALFRYVTDNQYSNVAQSFIRSSWSFSDKTAAEAVNLKNVVGDLRYTSCRVAANTSGLFTLKDIAKGSFIAEVRGYVCLLWEAPHRESIYNCNLNDFTFLFEKNGDKLLLDGRWMYNNGAFVRRSCKPNSELRVIWSQTDLHVMIKAKDGVELKANDEVTIAFEDGWKKRPRPVQVCPCRGQELKTCEIELFFKNKEQLVPSAFATAAPAHRENAPETSSFNNTPAIPRPSQQALSSDESDEDFDESDEDFEESDEDIDESDEELDESEEDIDESEEDREESDEECDSEEDDDDSENRD